MEKFNKQIIFNYLPSIKTMQKALIVQEEIGKLNTTLTSVFGDPKIPSRLFAFVESKYSSKIEGIYTTLFDVVNTGVETKQQNLIRPLVDELFKENQTITLERLKEIAKILNNNVSSESRWLDSFGIYKTVNDKKIKIYEPPLNKDETENLLKEVVTKANKDLTIIDMLHTHIIFEKIHPFQDGNGRLGRLLLQRSLSRIMNFASVLPLSHAIFSNLSDYYESFEISNNQDIDEGVSKMLDIVLKMINTSKVFTSEVKLFLDKNIKLVMNTSNKVTYEMAKGILLSLQTKSIYLVKTYGINIKTIDSVFNKLNEELAFNRKLANRNVLFWNIELESLVDKHYRA